MARPTYPGDLKDGRAVTANAFNSRVRPIFKTLDPSKVDGSGITSANIPVGSISEAKFSGGLVTTTNPAGSNDNQILTIDSDHIQRGILTYDPKWLTTASTTPDVSGGNIFIFDFASTVSIVDFLNTTFAPTLAANTVDSGHIIFVKARKGSSHPPTIVTRHVDDGGDASEDVPFDDATNWNNYPSVSATHIWNKGKANLTMPTDYFLVYMNYRNEIEDAGPPVVTPYNCWIQVGEVPAV